MTTGGSSAKRGIARRSTCRRAARSLGLVEGVGGHVLVVADVLFIRRAQPGQRRGGDRIAGKHRRSPNGGQRRRVALWVHTAAGAASRWSAPHLHDYGEMAAPR